MHSSLEKNLKQIRSRGLQCINSCKHKKCKVYKIDVKRKVVTGIIVKLLLLKIGKCLPQFNISLHLTDEVDKR